MSCSFDQALDIVTQLLDALHRAHLGEAPDFDIVPDGLIVKMDDNNRPVVRIDLDRGDDVCPPKPLSLWRYRAPERWWGAEKNSWTDQYALAALFVELVTGEAPFADVFATEDVNIVKTVLANRPPNLPADLPRRAVLLRALAKDPRARYRSCSAFVAALAGFPSAKTASSAEQADAQSRKTRVRRPLAKRTIAFALAAIAALVWGFKSGWLQQMLETYGSSRQVDYQKRVDAYEKARAAEQTSFRQDREAKLAALQAEIGRQSAVAAAALKEYRDFLANGGCAALSVSRDVRAQKARKAAEDLSTAENELTADRTLENALISLLQSGKFMSGVVPRAIPADSEVVAAYRNLIEKAKSLGDLQLKYTDRHPSVIAAQKNHSDAKIRFTTAIDGARKQIQTRIELREKTVDGLRHVSEAAEKESLSAEQAFAAAEAKQFALKRAVERESDRLADLRRKEIELRFGIRFGTASASTNRAEKAEQVAREPHL